MKIARDLQKHKSKIIIGIVIVAVLAGSFFLGNGLGGGKANDDGTLQMADAGMSTSPGALQPGQQAALPGDGVATSTAAGEGQNNPAHQAPSTADPDVVNPTGAAASATQQPENTAGPAQNPQGNQGAQNQQDNESQQGVQPSAQPSPQPGAQPSAQPGAQPSQQPGVQPSPQPGAQPDDDGQENDGQPEDDPDKPMTVTLIISVATILDNMDKLRDGKEGLIPANGIIFSGTVELNEGESVFNVLLREVRRNRIHMEFTNTPIYNSAYIEGINNIYEFDVGERSGWIYSVNGVFPNFGSSLYTLRDGDVVRWLFTCDRGADIGGEGAAGSYGWG